MKKTKVTKYILSVVFALGVASSVLSFEVLAKSVDPVDPPPMRCLRMQISDPVDPPPMRR